MLCLVPWLLMYLNVALTHGASVSRPWPAILFGLLSVGNALTTATGMYITVLSLLAVIFFISGRVRKISCAAASVVLVVFCQLAFPTIVPTPYPVQKSDAHQMFILPIQMTARYSSQFHDDVTNEQREAIDGFNMVSYDTMPMKYNPHLADPVIHLELRNPSYIRIGPFEHFSLWGCGTPSVIFKRSYAWKAAGLQPESRLPQTPVDICQIRGFKLMTKWNPAIGDTHSNTEARHI